MKKSIKMLGGIIESTKTDFENGKM